VKVWGGLVMNWKRSRERNSGQVRTIVAARNQKEAAALLDISVHYLRGYWSETFNDTERGIALARPGIVFQATTSTGDDFEPVHR
jgi:hypothetical protein